MLYYGLEVILETLGRKNLVFLRIFASMDMYFCFCYAFYFKFYCVLIINYYVFYFFSISNAAEGYLNQ